ncbi:MAG: hypothetical protein OXB92_14270 [Acidimicrobiaceae bacterium]|nr:hypothetical protein [Acidimicrobiia bacterium]MCY4495012.1 hypothetical protein [Acidimicrobiaceae bacterium]
MKPGLRMKPGLKMNEQCERPTEFRIAEEPETEMVSISRAELEAGEVGTD